MTRSSRAALALALAIACQLCVLGQTSELWATEHDEAAARVLFNEGRRLVDSGHYVEGCAKFEESLKLDPGVGTSFNLADCQERIGRTASAWARFLNVAAATRLEGQQERERVARARASALEPRLSRLTIDVGAKTTGLVIERDGLPVDAAAWGVPLPVDPGTHVVVARAPGAKEWSQTTSIPEGPSNVLLVVPPLESLPSSLEPATTLARANEAPSVAVQPLPALEPRRAWSPPVVVLGTLGVVVLSTSGVFALALSSENEQAKALCPESKCRDSEEKRQHDALVSDAHRDRAVAFIAAGVGTAGLVAAAYLLLRPKQTPQSAHSAWYAPRPVPGPLAIQVGTEW
jgi:hypothetical protein